jgi:hypothetical protein
LPLHLFYFLKIIFHLFTLSSSSFFFHISSLFNSLFLYIFSSKEHQLILYTSYLPKGIAIADVVYLNDILSVLINTSKKEVHEQVDVEGVLAISISGEYN